MATITVNDVLVTAMGFLPDRQSDNPELSDFIVGWINLLLQECLPTENSIRHAKGLPLLDAAPMVSSVTDVIDYQDEITRVALPYGVAYYVYIDDDNEYRSQDMRGRFVNALDEAQKAWLDESVVDVYA